MRDILLLFIMFLPFSVIAQKNQKQIVFAAGIDYRTYPIDIEDVPRGPAPNSTYGEMTGNGFWKTLSIHGRFGVKTKKNWLFSMICYTRYNHNHYLEDPHTRGTPTVVNFNDNAKDRKKIKFDIFWDAEKKIRLRKNKETYFTVLAGIGFTNINSGTNFMYQENNFSGTSDPATYKGTYFQFTPRLSIGYQYKRIKGSIDGYVIEDPGKTDLTSLWLGATLSYEFNLRSKKGK